MIFPDFFIIYIPVHFICEFSLVMELCVLATERMMVLFYVRGVDQSAAASEIKKAYRRAALRHHPDKVY